MKTSVTRWKYIIIMDHDGKAIKKYSLDDKGHNIDPSLKVRNKRRKFNRLPPYSEGGPPQIVPQPVLRQQPSLKFSINSAVIFDRESNLIPKSLASSSNDISFTNEANLIGSFEDLSFGEICLEDSLEHFDCFFQDEIPEISCDYSSLTDDGHFCPNFEDLCI